MSLLDHRENSTFIKLFADPKNQDALLSFLNNMIQASSPLVSAKFDLKSEKGVFRRDFSAIYVISGENEAGCPVEVSLTLGMGEKMIPPWRQSFLRMVLGNTVVEGHNEKPLHLYGLMLMDEHHKLSPHPHDMSMLQIEKWEEQHGDFMREQRFHVFALENFVFRNPMIGQELWLCFLKDHNNKLLLDHPMKPPALQKALDVVQKLEKK